MWYVFSWSYFSYFVKNNKKINVLVYFIKKRLTGEAVFPGKKFNDVLKKNKECAIDFSRSIYENLSKECKNLLQMLLEKDPLKRINSK